MSFAPNLSSFLGSLKESPTNVELSLQTLVDLFKRRQIRGSRQCAIATAHLLKQVIRRFKARDTVSLIKRVQDVGQKLTDAQPKELAISNIIRRILGVIRDEADGDKEGDAFQNYSSSEPGTPRKKGSMSPPQGQQNGVPVIADLEALHRPPLLTSHTSYMASTNGPIVTSMFSLLSQPLSDTSTPGSQSPAQQLYSSFNPTLRPQELSAEVIDGIDEIIDELDNMDDQIASYAIDHIHSNEIILTHGTSLTVQRFLLRAASKRRFTVIHAEGYPNQHHETHATITGKHKASSDGDPDQSDVQRFAKPLIEAGITVVLIPDAAVFALMSRVNKVILGTHAVLANGGLIASAGVKSIALAAREHRTPVVVVTGVYKLCPTFVFDFDSFIEYGEPGCVLGCAEDSDLIGKVDVENPLHDYVEGELVDLFITNLGGHAPFSLSSVITEQYRSEDTDLAVGN
ncbi:MAG: hypothetical protein GOMPHAMPRED_007187 [Gomphillus americanus]|uniref:Translation initiation factor eIF2B subunit beta n=1 Tax=Gomphillus americanus TaxID=1940652 RepID=A0A8H3ERF9_9LECA|nr:MAG: hypothetical protein GOMPHAMPRED_007187 [Gomphillus americanus]